MAPLWYSLRAQELTGYGNASARFKDSFLTRTRFFVKDDSTGFMPERADLRMPLFVLMGMVGVLAAMCAVNVATLLLLRAAGRVREISMRYALGAARTRIISQLLVEGGVLGVCGAAAGVALSPLIASTLVRLMINSDDPTRAPYSSNVDARILLFAAGCVSAGDTGSSALLRPCSSCVPDWLRLCASRRGPHRRSRSSFARLRSDCRLR
jgi:putative ABC transport system permease protein